MRTTCYYQQEPTGESAQGGSRISKAVRDTVPRVADTQSGAECDAMGYAATRLSGMMIIIFKFTNQWTEKSHHYVIIHFS